MRITWSNKRTARGKVLDTLLTAVMLFGLLVFVAVLNEWADRDLADANLEAQEAQAIVGGLDTGGFTGFIEPPKHVEGNPRLVYDGGQNMEFRSERLWVGTYTFNGGEITNADGWGMVSWDEKSGRWERIAVPKPLRGVLGWVSANIVHLWEIEPKWEWIDKAWRSTKEFFGGAR